MRSNKTNKIEINDMLSKCTRVEIIDQNGRAYVNWHESNNVELSLQDDNRTLKIFIIRKI